MATGDGFAAMGSYLGMLSLALGERDLLTQYHCERVVSLCDEFGRRLGLGEDELARLRLCAAAHDIGKIGIPDAILRKPGRLTTEEFDILKQHVSLGDAIVRDQPDLPDLDLIRSGIRFHHERWDGRGYLLGMTGEEIPLVARILAVADAFSAITTTRPYRKGLAIDEALKRIEDAAGTQLDPALVQAFIVGFRSEVDVSLPTVPAQFDSAPALTIPGRQVA